MRNLIKDRLKILGKNQAWLAEGIISREHLNKILNNHTRPNVEIAMKIADKLLCEVKDLWVED